MLDERENLSEANSAFVALFHKYKGRAKKRSLPFSLTKDQFFSLTQSPCHYCNEKPWRPFSRGSVVYFYNGIDRIDNFRGYVTENCVTCCQRCNFLKGSLSYGAFISHVGKICATILSRATLSME